MVITADGVYSKHYYAGSQRIVRRLGSSDAGIFETACVGCKPQTTDNEFDANKLQQAQKNDLQGYADKLKRGTIVYKDYKPVPLAVQEKALQEENATMLENPDGTNSTPLQRLGEEEARRVVPIYYYHPDHLGTSTALTDFNGNAYQIFLNLPFGETMAQQLGSNYYNSPYKFNGKELDEETGFYYYGARYYDPRISIWQSVDPLAEKYPSWSPYNFCYNNPLRFIDPDGRESDDIIFTDKKGNQLATYHDGKKEITNVVLPIDDYGSSPNVNLNKATDKLPDVDIIGIGISAEATYVVGAGMGQEFLYFLDGQDKGQTFAYTFGSVTAGLGAEGVSVSAIAGNFLNNDKILSANDYLGPFNFYSGNTPVAGVSYFWGSKTNEFEFYPGMAKLWNSDYKQTWSGITASAPGPNASGTIGRSNYIFTPYLNELLQKCGLQKK